jgi:hypothetical protein
LLGPHLFVRVVVATESGARSKAQGESGEGVRHKIDYHLVQIRARDAHLIHEPTNVLHEDEDGETEDPPQEAWGAARAYGHRARVPKYLAMERATAYQK